MSVAEARQAFVAALCSGLIAGDRGTDLRMTETSVWRREVEGRGIKALIEAVGAETNHPVADDIRSRFLGVFVMAPGAGGHSHQRAARLVRWMGTPDFAETVKRWRSLAPLAPEYARELMS